MMPVTITPEEGDDATVRLRCALDEMVLRCGLDPKQDLGARVKLAICELYEAVPPGFESYITVVVRHSFGCATLLRIGDWHVGDCNCNRTVEIRYPDAGEPVIVH